MNPVQDLSANCYWKYEGRTSDAVLSLLIFPFILCASGFLPTANLVAATCDALACDAAGCAATTGLNGPVVKATGFACTGFAGNTRAAVGNGTGIDAGA